MSLVQLDMLELEPAAGPPGFAYRNDLISATEEAALAARFAELPFREFEFHGFLGKRRTVSFGLRYDFADSKVHVGEPIPEFLLPLRERAAAFAGIAAASVEHALVTEYAPGAAIGWHRDRPVFGDVIGISFLSACRFRFRRPLPAAPSPSMGEGRGGGDGAAALSPWQRGAAPSPPPNPPPSRGRAFGWERLAATLQPRSTYLLRGVARHEWEHSIPPAEALRYSVTFRTVPAR